jgi:ankyrin repeat protein
VPLQPQKLSEQEIRSRAEELNVLLINNRDFETIQQKLDETPKEMWFAVLKSRDKYDYMPLGLAAERGRMEDFIKALKEAGIDKEELKELLQTSDKFGHTPLHLAANNTNMADLISTLKDFGIDEKALVELLEIPIQSGNSKWNGKTPLDIVAIKWSLRQGSEETFVATLKQHFSGQGMTEIEESITKAKAKNS